MAQVNNNSMLANTCTLHNTCYRNLITSIGNEDTVRQALGMIVQPGTAGTEASQDSRGQADRKQGRGGGILPTRPYLIAPVRYRTNFCIRGRGC